MNVTVRIEGLGRVLAKLNTDWGSVLTNITWSIGELIRNEMARYPGPRSGPVRWTSERQRRFYHAMRREKGLSLVYTRRTDPMSQDLGAGWTVDRYGAHGAVVAAHASYAPYVQSHTVQQRFHADTGWVTDKQAVERVERSGDVQRIGEAAIRRALR